MKIKSYCKKISYGCCILLLAGVLGGCSGKGGQSLEPMGASELAPVATLVESYGDIELPIEMELDAKKSMALRTDSFKGGVSIYRGRVDMASLRDYIIASMRNNKWKLVGEASYDSVMLAFTKPNKTCMVVLEESSAGSLGKTQANYYVTVDVAAASRLNPFGEPIKQ
jgi:hypothetical protein